MQCPNCGSPVDQMEMFCGQCGVQVRTEPPLPTGIQPLAPSPARSGLGTGAKVALVAVLLLLLAAVAACASSVLGCGGCCFFFSQEPPIEVALDYPQTVQVGQEFALQVTLRNVGDGNVPIDGVWFDDALLKGMTVLSSEPPFQGQRDLFSATSFLYDASIPPGGTMRFAFRLRATSAGEHVGKITASSDPGSKATEMRIVVK